MLEYKSNQQLITRGNQKQMLLNFKILFKLKIRLKTLTLPEHHREEMADDFLMRSMSYDIDGTNIFNEVLLNI